MPINPELMKLIAGGGGAAGAMQPGSPSPGQASGAPSSAPVASPMATPEPKEGEKAGAMPQVQMAMDILEKTLVAFGSESEEGAVILDCLGKLSKQFGDKRDKAKELIPAELMSLMSLMPKGPGGAHPPMPGGAPGGGMPPPM